MMKPEQLAVEALRKALNGPYISIKRDIIRKCAAVCFDAAYRYSIDHAEIVREVGRDILSALEPEQQKEQADD